MNLSEYHGVKVYLVGGAVRDELLKLPCKDRDYVVTGATQEMMQAAGFQAVGHHFPVFLHPETGEEYALARTERSTGSGYTDFECVFDPSITIEQDLYRRDLTINAIAKDMETGEYIDPYGGRNDLENGILRACNPRAFIEDPVRVLRLARFSARFPAFTIDRDTGDLARRYTNAEDCHPDRVWKEFTKALMELKPSRFFAVLDDLCWLAHWFPEVAMLVGQTQPVRWHAEGDAYVHTMMVLDAAAHQREDFMLRLGCLVHDFGKGLTPYEKLPSHPGHEAAGVKPVQEFCARFGVGRDTRIILESCAFYHMHVHKAGVIKPKTYVKVATHLKTESNIRLLGRIGHYDNQGRLPCDDYGNTEELFVEGCMAVLNTKLSSRYQPEEIKAMSVDTIKNKIHHMRMAAVEKVVKELKTDVYTY